MIYASYDYMSFFSQNHFKDLILDNELRMKKLINFIKRSYTEHHYEMNSLNNQVKIMQLKLDENEETNDLTKNMRERNINLRRNNDELKKRIKNLEDEKIEYQEYIDTIETKLNMLKQIEEKLKTTKNDLKILTETNNRIRDDYSEIKSKRLSFYFYLNKILNKIAEKLFLEKVKLESDESKDFEKLRLEKIEKQILNIYNKIV